MVESLGERDRRRLRRREPGRAVAPALPHRGVLPGRHRPARRRGEARAGHRRTGVDGPRHPAQRHVRRLAGGHDGAVGSRRRLRHGDELCRRRARTGGRSASPPWPSCRATSHRAAPGWGCAPSASRCGRATDGEPTTSLSERVPAHLGRGRRGGGAHRHLHRHHPLRPPLRAGPRAARRRRRRRRSWPARRPTRWPTRSTAFVRAAVVRLDLQDEAVEVVLGGGIFDTTDTAFHDRVAAGIRAAAPAPCSSASTPRPSSAPRSSGSTPSVRRPVPARRLREALASHSPTGGDEDLKTGLAPPVAQSDGAPGPPARRAPAVTAARASASATRRSSSASSAWARSFTISMISGCSSGFHPSSSSVSPVRRASVSLSSAVVPAAVRWRSHCGAPAPLLDHAGGHQAVDAGLDHARGRPSGDRPPR